MADTLYVCTGINRITGVREQCSMKAPKEVAELFIETWKKNRKHNKAYIKLRMEPYEPEINFNKKKR